MKEVKSQFWIFQKDLLKKKIMAEKLCIQSKGHITGNVNKQSGIEDAICSGRTSDESVGNIFRFGHVSRDPSNNVAIYLFPAFSDSINCAHY